MYPKSFIFGETALGGMCSSTSNKQVATSLYNHLPDRAHLEHSGTNLKVCGRCIVGGTISVAAHSEGHAPEDEHTVGSRPAWALGACKGSLGATPDPYD